MFTVGEFSRITALSVKALRFYHDEGILVPDYIDEDTGYRYYRESSVERAEVIASLRRMDFPVAEIREILTGYDDDSDITSFLEKQKSILSEKIARCSAASDSIDETIRMIRRNEMIAKNADYEINETELDDIIFAGCRYKGRYDEVGKYFRAVGKAAGRFIAGSAMCLYYDDDYREKDADIEAGFPLSKSVTADGVDCRILKGGRAVTIVHKGNIMKFTEGGFKNWGYALAEREFGEYVFTWQQYDRIKAELGGEAADKAQADALAAGRILLKDVICDAFLQQILTRPKEYDVIATMNLNGDYLSDALAAQVGGIGIAPGANINYDTGHAVFEATHGTAPKYAGLDKVNPGSVILSGVMMLEYMEWQVAADLIVNAITKTIQQKTVTYDFARLMDGATEVKCSEFADAIIKNL